MPFTPREVSGTIESNVLLVSPPISNPNDKIEAPIIACNNNFQAARMRRPSTPSSKVKKTTLPGGVGGNNGTDRKGRDDKSQGSRIRSASAGRDPKSEMCSRYWSYLFENLERSISEIYEGCEKEENIPQCKEVLFILENYSRDFKNLIDWFNVKWNYEKTSPPMRPTALAWEIRKPTLCLLPHTLAYEKLVLGLSKETNSLPEEGRKVESVLLEPLAPIGLLSGVKSDEVHVDSCHGSPKITSGEPLIVVSVALTNPPDLVVVPPTTTTNAELMITVVDVGLQTDLEEDPDIYYFAGGRIVACQTDYCEEYPPLTFPFPSFESYSSDAMTESQQSLEANQSALFSENITNNNKSLSPTSESLFVCESNQESGPVDLDPNNQTPYLLATKSSATQLSAGVFIDERPREDVSSKPTTPSTPIVEEESSSKEVKEQEGVQQVDVVSSSVKSTFADKAKTGMLRQSQTQAKSVSSYLNKIGVGGGGNNNNNKVPSTALSTSTNLQQLTTGQKARVATTNNKSTTVAGNQGGTNNNNIRVSGPPGQRAKVPSIPNYRSNIASRCRTAVNTSGQQPLLQHQESSSQQVNKSLKNCPPKSVGGASGTPPAPGLGLTGSGLSDKLCGKDTNSHKKSPLSLDNRLVEKNKKWKGHQEAVVRGDQKGATSRPLSLAMGRSKSMINPIIGGGKGVNNNKNGPLKVGGGVTTSKVKGPHSNSYVSLPDETRRSGTVDEDGWETVKTRSSRSKWSSSNSSLASFASSNANQSRSSLDKGFILPTNKNSEEKKNEPIIVNSSSSSGNDNKIEEPAAATKVVATSEVKAAGCEDEEVDEEEIKKKEADLDDAIREEELLEQELLQVEKEFERIERERTEEVTTTDSEHATSPEVVDVDLDLENDHSFFVSMNDQEMARIELQELPPRETGRILSLREKLMSPAKKCDGAERLKRYEAKLAKAERNREKLLQSKFNRYVELSDRFEALNETTKKLVAERAELIVKAEERRRRAAEKRKEYLKSIRRKAHDEDSKAKEIAFINLLEAQNKRHDYFASAQEVEERLQTIQEERRIKLEERAGKASGVIRRQSHIKKDWQAKLIEFQEKRRKADERIQREKEERAKERTEMAMEKARDREVRMCALNAAKQAEKEELEKKIRRKQEDTARRHEENMEHIRQKAQEFSAPRIMEDNSAPPSLRICTLCKIIIENQVQELGHLRGRAHLEAVKKMDKLESCSNVSLNGNGLESLGLKFIADVQAEKMEYKLQPDKNRQKGAKKHTKKLLQKLMDSGLEFENTEKEIRGTTDLSNNKDSTSGLKGKTRKNILELGRLVQLFETNKGSPSAALAMDRLLSEIRRAAVKTEYVKDSVISMNGVAVGQKVLDCMAKDLPLKTKIGACDMLQGFVLGNLRNGLYILRGTAVCSLINLCSYQWNSLVPDDVRWTCASPIGNNQLPTDPLIEALIALLFNLLGNVPDPFNGVMKKGSGIDEKNVAEIKKRTHDIIGYMVASGVIDRISVYCGGVRGPVDNQPGVASLLQISMDFLVCVVYALQFCWGSGPTGCIMNKKEPDGTQLLATLEASELAGAVSMSYSLLLHQGAPTRPRTGIEGDCNPPPPPLEKTAEVVKSTFCFINAMARLDLMALQNVLGSEAVSLQFRHIASQLLWQVVPHRENYSIRRLLTELIIAIGNFTVGNEHNQRVIQSGQTPTVLQMLCTLPPEYYTDPKYSHNFLATLLAATYGSPENREVLIENNIDVEMLERHMNSELGKQNVIVMRLVSMVKNVNKKVKKGEKRPLEEVNQITCS